ncbi:MAG TPA: DUF2147 domain-containing protein [Pseudoxanthomonas sp.]|nr:DUF2147 domain-containing protein [Pseudoxanthomonas sp.]
MLATSAAAADVVGRWRTIDDQTKQAKSIVEISRAADGTYTGRIVELLRPSRPNPICDKCRDDRRNRPIIGMEIIRGMRKDGGSWSGGSILNPDEGKVYRSKMQLIDGGDKLEVSGCIAVFCKSQIWIRQQ